MGHVPTEQRFLGKGVSPVSPGSAGPRQRLPTSVPAPAGEARPWQLASCCRGQRELQSGGGSGQGRAPRPVWRGWRLCMELQPRLRSLRPGVVEAQTWLLHPHMGWDLPSWLLPRAVRPPRGRVIAPLSGPWPMGLNSGGPNGRGGAWQPFPWHPGPALPSRLLGRHPRSP